jgi:hypothetical protein
MRSRWESRIAPPALGGTAPDNAGAIELGAAAADAALTATRTTTHKVDLYCLKRSGR